MQTAMIEVKYVNEPKPGKQYGSIKGANNDSWPVKADRIREFEPGNQYELAYTEGNNGFKNIIGVKKIIAEATRPARSEGASFVEPGRRNGATLMEASAPAQTKAQAPANGYYRPTAPKDSERMWTCAILGHYVDRGEVPLHKESVKAAINLLREAYQETYGKDDA